MPDKLTDSEIVNIAEYCSNFGDCKFCKIILPNSVKKGTNGCFSCLLKLMLSVISVKENEKEKMRYRLADTIIGCAAHEQTIKAEAYKEFAELLRLSIVNKPSEFKASQATVDFLNGATHRQHEILDEVNIVLKELGYKE